MFSPCPGLVGLVGGGVGAGPWGPTILHLTNLLYLLPALPTPTSPPLSPPHVSLSQRPARPTDTAPPNKGSFTDHLILRVLPSGVRIAVPLQYIPAV